MNKDLVAIFEYLEREKGIKRDIVIEAIEESLRAAAKKSIEGASNVTVKIHPKTGNIEVFCEKEIVEEVEVHLGDLPGRSQRDRPRLRTRINSSISQLHQKISAVSLLKKHARSSLKNCVALNAMSSMKNTATAPTN